MTIVETGVRAIRTLRLMSRIINQRRHLAAIGIEKIQIDDFSGMLIIPGDSLSGIKVSYPDGTEVCQYSSQMGEYKIVDLKVPHEGYYGSTGLTKLRWVYDGETLTVGGLPSPRFAGEMGWTTTSLKIVKLVRPVYPNSRPGDRVSFLSFHAQEIDDCRHYAAKNFEEGGSITVEYSNGRTFRSDIKNFEELEEALQFTPTY